MKKCNNKIKANKYAFGAKEITDGLSAVGNIAQGFNSGNQTAQSVFSGLDSIENFASSINPIAGMAVKGVAGVGKAITSIVGTKGSVDQVTGEITEGTGILGRKNRSKLRQQSGIVKNNIAAAQNSARYAADWYSENGYNEPTMVANGGVIPNTLAYLDDGEFYRTPDGEVGNIPDKGRPAGSDMNLVNAPVGTQVFSEKLKNPETGNSFAEDAKKINKKYKLNSNKTDKYGQNTSELNQINGHKELDELMNKQEQFKAKKNIRKNKSMQYEDGTNGMKQNRNWFQSFKDNTQSFIINGVRDRYLNLPEQTPKIEYFDNKPVVYNTENAFENNKPQYYAKPQLGLFQNGPAINSGLIRAGWSHAGNNETISQEPIQYFVGSQKAKPQGGKKSNKINTLVPPPKAEYNKPDFDFSRSIKDEDVWKISDKQKRNWSKSYSPSTTSGQPTTSSEKKSSFDYADLLGSLAGLVAPIQNITAKRGETNVPYTYTPKYGPTNWNISPMLNEINRTNSISRYNMSNINPNTGANMAYGIQSAIARDNAIAQAYSEKLNKESIMAAQNADIYNRWAQFDTTARHTAAVENAQDRAALDNVRRTGWRDLSTALQTMSKDRRLSKKDKALLEAMKPYLDYGMTSEQLNNLYNLLG